MAIKNSWASGEVLTAADLTDTFKGVFINAQSGTTYTLGTADSFVSISNASGGTVTIPTNATAAFNTGAVVGIMNAGTTGTFTIAGAGGVTINTTTGGTTLLPLETVYVVKLGTNTWQTKRDPGVANAGGLVYITGSTFSAVASVSVNNCFTSSYQNYKVFFNATSANTSIAMNFRLRASGSDNTTTNYFSGGIYSVFTGSTVSATNYNAATSWTPHFITQTTGNCRSMDILDPQSAARTVMASIGSNGDANAYYSGIFNADTQFDGFTLYPATGNITGTVRVYGYRNS